METLDQQRWRDTINVARLVQWMDERGLGSGPLEEEALLTGGTQNILLRFRREGRYYVLRRPPRHLRKNSSDTMRREARVLAALAASDVPHPRLIAACDNDEVLGVAFYLMEPVAGFNATTGMPSLHADSSDIRHQMGLSLVDSIAALGRVDHVAKELADFGRVEGYLERQVGRWRHQLQSYHEFPEWPGERDLQGTEEISAWLAANVPSEFVPGIIHGDYHFANVLFCYDAPRVAAIVDWELSTIGDPLLDLGWLLATWHDPIHDRRPANVQPWTGLPTPSELIGRYGDQVDRDISTICWFSVLACFKLGIILEGTFARACAGRAPVETGERLHGSAVDLFRRAQRFMSMGL
jgi:aminoglycoside phosphotransferase (APT) family kinase protein